MPPYLGLSNIGNMKKKRKTKCYVRKKILKTHLNLNSIICISMSPDLYLFVGIIADRLLAQNPIFDQKTISNIFFIYFNFDISLFRVIA